MWALAQRAWEAALGNAEAREEKTLKPHIAHHDLWADLTPELSRAVLRPRRRDNVPCGGAAAKRSRLERIVSAHAVESYESHPQGTGYARRPDRRL